MTEDQARIWVDTLGVSRETSKAIDRFVALLRDEASRQNLVAASTLDSIWNRHIVDSLQLAPLAPANGRWIDLGAGAGFPGLMIAMLGRHHVTLVEPRRQRVAFLEAAAEALGVAKAVLIVAKRVEAMAEARFDVISARAFAPLERLLALGGRFAGDNTLWLLPKGRGAKAELDAARGTWQGEFRIVPSITDPESAIIVAANVSRASAGKKR